MFKVIIGITAFFLIAFLIFFFVSILLGRSRKEMIEDLIEGITSFFP